MSLRLVELFAGIGAQRRALENVGERERESRSIRSASPKSTPTHSSHTRPFSGTSPTSETSVQSVPSPVVKSVPTVSRANLYPKLGGGRD